MHIIEIVLIFSDTIKIHKTDGCLYPLAVLVGASCVPSYWSDTWYTCNVDSRNFTAEFNKTIFYCGFTYLAIVLLLFVINHIKISLRQLNRILKSNILRRPTVYTPEYIVKITFRMKLRQAVGALVDVLRGNGW